MFSYEETNATKGDYQVNKHALPKNIIIMVNLKYYFLEGP